MPANIIELGINVDTFTPQKLVVLNEFVAAFDKLDKYDNKTFNPILGGGMIEFNKSIKETGILLDDLKLKINEFNSLSVNPKIVEQKVKQTKATKDLAEEERRRLNAGRQQAEQDKTTSANKKKEIEDTQVLKSQYDRLSDTLRAQAKLYQELYLSKGKNAPETRQALADYSVTAKSIGEIDRKLDDAGGRTKLFNGLLADTFSHIRTIAYILPGIGIAGIFNLAFEAIGNAADGLELFSSKLEKFIEFQQQVNEHILENIELVNKLNDSIRSLSTKREGGAVSPFDAQQILEARGTDETAKLINASTKAQSELLILEGEITKRGLAPETLKSDLDRRLQELESYRQRVEKINQAIEIIENPAKRPADPSKRRGDISISRGTYVEGVLNPTKETLEGLKKGLTEKTKILQSQFDTDSELLDRYLTKQNDYFITRNELAFHAEQELRERTLAFAKSEIDVSIAKNQVILNDDIYSEQKKSKAIEDIRKKRISEQRAEYHSVVTDRTSTQVEQEIAFNKMNAEIAKINIKAGQEQINLHEDFLQRRIKATAEINKNEVDKESIKNERIYKDENKSLDERLAAYEKYLVDRQKLQDIEFYQAIQTRKLRANDPTAQKEIEALQSNRATQQANIQADAQRQSYEIVYSSLNKELKLIKDINASESLDNKNKYDIELQRLNKQLAEKDISYHKFAQKREKLDEEYRFKIFDEDVRDDEADLVRIRTQIDEEQRMKTDADKKVAEAKDNLDFVKASGEGDILEAKRKYDVAVGNQEAINKAIFDLQKEEDAKEKDLIDDKIKRDKARADLSLALERELYRNRKAIIDALFNLIKQVGDEEYEERVRKLQDQKETQSEVYESEIDAIERSSLTAKEKFAADVQLNAQKQQMEKEATAAERKAKHDQAVFDKEVTIAHILLNTEEAVTAALALSHVAPGVAEAIAIERGILGGIQLATALLVKIPSYAKGTKSHEGGYARYGEEGPEILKEPYKSPYLVMGETVSYLPKGTEIIPINDSPEFTARTSNSGWEQVRWLAGQITKGNKDVKTTVKNTINIDLGFETYKVRVLYGKP